MTRSKRAGETIRWVPCRHVPSEHYERVRTHKRVHVTLEEAARRVDLGRFRAGRPVGPCQPDNRGKGEAGRGGSEGRSKERRVGKAWVSTCRSRGAPAQ